MPSFFLRTVRQSAYDPFASAELSLGSYGTFVGTFAAGSGLMKSGLYFNAAYSRGLTDGYIRNAFADVQSAMAVVGWMNQKNSLRLTWLMGDQRTGIAWNGISPEQYAVDRRYNPAGEWTGLTSLAMCITMIMKPITILNTTFS